MLHYSFTTGFFKYHGLNCMLFTSLESSRKFVDPFVMMLLRAVVLLS